MGNVPEPIFINLEFIFFLIWRFFRGIGEVFGALLFGKNFTFGGGSGPDGAYALFDSQNYNPFLDQFSGELGSAWKKGFGFGGGWDAGFSGGGLFSGGGGSIEFFANLGQGLRVFLFLLTILLIIFLVWIWRKHRGLVNDSNKKVKALGIDVEAAPSNREDSRWERIVGLANSSNSSDWKISIFEADLLLDELLIQMQYHGDNLGERLKSVEPSDFLTLQSAWSAHIVRNKIAHEGGFQIDQRETRRVIALFEEVFREFEFI